MRTFLLVIISLLSGCASNKSLVEQCAEFSGEMHPVVAVPLLLTGCIGAAVADEVFAVGKVVVGAPVGIGSQVYNAASGGAEPGAFPFHGNWCGPGRPAKDATPEQKIVKDELDQACKNHDMCYEKQGYYSCRCDVQLIRDIRENKNMPNYLILKAALVTEYFENSYCKGCKQAKSGLKIFWSCHRPQEYGCRMGPISSTDAYAWCP